ncbi:isoleucine--tRNA ligase [Mucilaginibacter sp. HMF7410]|uniref:Isoleucine--tRNA ligase n=2 Tax=Mucilaginibacter arboris TaxID=2682090 RepID=A0A7K1SX75_9SPHI|nr:isoleucine--tRNA ligase [Mucilaginibacter arboris]
MRIFAPQKSEVNVLMYKEYKQLNLPELGNEILEFWKQNNIFEKSISSRPASKPYTFYEGPPSANGMPGIHHVMARSIKDIFCRYKTLKGFQVKRKGGWDTHGLPIELAVEKALGITKDDIGKKISIEDYNAECRKEVMKYTDVWNDMTEKMGYWVDLEDPYITYKNEYIETLWWILKEFYKKGYLYKGYTVQPYSPAAGTGLSSHELNQPGTYRNVKDTSITAEFHLINNQIHPLIPVLFEEETEDTAILAWTTTPWTLPSNCALAVGDNITYVKIRTFNPYTYAPVSVVLAKDLINQYFKKEGENASFTGYKSGDKIIPWEIAAEFKGAELVGLRYHQLMPYVDNEDLEQNAFRVIPGDFVTTDDGTGIVHTASIFGADDFRVARANGVPSVLVKDENGKEVPLVNKQGRFVDEVTDFAGRFVKEEYYSDAERADPDFKPTDVLIAIKLKEDNKAFDVKKYEHSYPHCWRTDKPVLYYPLDSWFIKTTAVKERMVELNKTINWKPESTGTGRFGNWLENLVDWNLSRSRYWGTPLPIWRTEDGSEEICIGSIKDLKNEIQKSIDASFMPQNFVLEDLHRPFVDDVILVSSTGKKMFREPDLIDVWFDSGAMPYAQHHFPFENKEAFTNSFPADFIAEGVDQTRGWFFTLHAIAVMLMDSVAYKNVVSNGLVLDKNGNKMSKRLGNAVDPFKTLEQYGPDATRWYMISNASPWDNLKFNLEGLDEVRRKFFGTLYNTYSFFALYANIDNFEYEEADIELQNRPEIDRWILSLLNTLSAEVDGFYADFEPTKAARAIQDFVDAHLSNWYVRLSRRRFWKGDYSEDKLSAYQTLYTCLVTIAKLMSPIAPFFAERLFCDLNGITNKEKRESVHLADFPLYHPDLVDKELEERMQLAQDISSLTLSLRKKVGINVRQPLSKILLPILNPHFQQQIEQVKELILSETNIKNIEYITDNASFISKKIKPNFKALGKKVGKDMKLVAEAIGKFSPEDINKLEQSGQILIPDTSYLLLSSEVEITAEDVPGWQVASLGKLTVALDVALTEELKQEGVSRELVNRIQNLRKSNGLEVTDRINIRIEDKPIVTQAVRNNLSYICAEILAADLVLDTQLSEGEKVMINDEELLIDIKKYNEN